MVSRRSWTRSLVLLALLIAPVGPTAGASAPNDPGFEDQWALETIGAPKAWEGAKGKGVTIAIVDTGVQLDHEDLAGKIAADVSCIGANGNPANCTGRGRDDHGHGTHVAGIAAAQTFNRIGVAGTAPEARILAVRVLEADGDGGASGTAGDVRAGIRWAVNQGADVINLSLSELVVIRNVIGSGIAGAVEDAWRAGAIPVVAAGNTNLLFGSGYQDVPAMVVTATDRNDRRASYATSVADARWGMAAPGGEASDRPDVAILSTWWDPQRNDAYAVAAGTSMAVPHVSGAAAVLRSLGLTPQQTVDRLLDTAAPVSSTGTGAGRLDLAAAVGTAGTGGTGSPPAPENGPSGGSGEPVTTTTPPAPSPRSDPPPGGAAGDPPEGSAGPAAPLERQIVRVPAPTTSTAPAAEGTTTTSVPGTLDDSAATHEAVDSEEDEGGSLWPAALVVALVVLSLVPAISLLRRRETSQP